MLAFSSPIGPPPATLWARETLPQDAYQDAQVEALLARARAARLRTVEGIDSYEGKLRQRIYTGLTALRFRRERGLFEHERIANIRWTSDGRRVIQWTGVRTAIPIAGLDTGRPGGAEPMLTLGDTSFVGVRANQQLERDMADDLLDETDMPGFDFDPGGDRLRFGEDNWALDPLADTALAHYRFSSGDTLRIDLPADQPDLVLYEVLVEPRRADFNLVAGSLWFDSESASLVRATYKPARPYNLAIDEPGESDDVPGFLQPIEAEIDYITIEYSLQEQRYWLPRRFAFQGEARLGSFLRIPMTLEWNVGSYLVNEAARDLFVEGELPDGWRRQENMDVDQDGNENPTIVIVPTVEELRQSPDLSQRFGERSPLTFSSGEIDRLQDRLEGLLPTYQRFRPQFAWGLQRGMVRYNRVEGLSVGTAVTVPLTPKFDFDGTVRLGGGDRDLNATSALLWGPESSRWTTEAYHRLESMSEFDNPFGLISSADALFLGGGAAQFYRATGVSLGYEALGERVRYSVTGFSERQRGVALETDYFLFDRFIDDTVDAVLAADDVNVAGVRGAVGWFRGIDPNGLILTGRLAGEVGGGDRSYRRVMGAASLSHPLPLGLAGAIELGAGSTWGDVTLQREFFLGGSPSLRGFGTNHAHGTAFWRARGELATGLAAARIGVFSDVGWVGPRDDVRFDDPLLSVGIGTSLLDGLFRFDVARAVRGATGWKFHLYLDGLF